MVSDYKKYDVIAVLSKAEKYLNNYKKGGNSMDKITNFRDENFFLSNFYNTSILYKRQVFQNAESAFQSAKCKDKIDRMRFINISGKEAKKLGRKIKLREDWEEVKENVMYQVVFEKFKQNSYLCIKLLKTEDREIEEHNHWKDFEWGICNGKGENKLGKILMKVRDELRELE